MLVFEQGSWQTDHSHFTPGWRQKINWDMERHEFLKPVLKTEQSLLARKRRTILQWNPVENKISNFGDIFPLYSNFVYHSLSLNSKKDKSQEKTFIFMDCPLICFDTLNVYIYITVVKEFMYFHFTMWSMLLLHAFLSASIRLMLSCLELSY